VTKAAEQGTAQAESEFEETMICGLMIDFGVGVENRGVGAGDPAFRCGYSPGGSEGTFRDAGSPLAVSAGEGKWERIEIIWAPEVAWRKTIHISHCYTI
jgi:hypothetical protein